MRGRDGLIHVLGDGSVLLEGTAVPIALEGLRALGRERRGNGTGLPAVAVELADWLMVAAELAVRLSQAQNGSVAGTSTVPRRPSAPSSPSQDPVDVEEAAVQLQHSESYVRRMCRAGAFVTARKSAGAWLIDRAEVVARATARSQEAS